MSFWNQKPAILLFSLLISNAYLAIANVNDAGNLRAAVQNPISSLISLPLKFTFDYGAPNGGASFMNIQPVVHFAVGEWNLVNRLIIPCNRKLAIRVQ
jgi:hypothetical protein